MKKVLLLLANGFEVYEASVFIDVMGWDKTYGSKDTELITCGLSKHLESSFNFKVEVDKLISEINVNDFDALAIPGGFEPYGFYEDSFHPDFLQLIQEFNNSNNIIATICVAALPVGKSGVLKGGKGTTYNLSGGKRQKQLAQFGVDIINQPIVENDNIITSWGPATAIDVAFLLLERLTDKANIREVRTLMGFK